MDIFIKGQRSNFDELQHIGPYHSIHDEPSPEELSLGNEQSIKINNIFLSDDFVHHFVSNIFSYRINKSESVIQNFYEFFTILLKKKKSLYYSPQFGISLWVYDLGFIKYEPLESILSENTYVYFEDYITETTTFVRYHYEYRYDNMWNYSFRILFAKKVMRELLKFGKSIKREFLISSCIECALNMLEIRFYN